MKTALKFTECNAGNYLAQKGTVCQPEDAEFYAITLEGDTLKNDEILGITLTRKGKIYTQVQRMKTFRGIAFLEWAAAPVEYAIKLKMIPK